MKVKPGYKKTDIGVMPEEWSSAPCSELCIKIQDGTHFSPKIRGNDFLYITSKNIRFGYLDIATADRIDAKQHETIYKRCDVKCGDLLLTKDGANTGNAALNTLTEQFSLLSSVALLRFDEKSHSAAYFLQQFLSNTGQRRMKDAMSGNAITRLTLEKIRKLRLPVAPLSEQRAIAQTLGDVDALIAALDRLIAKKRDIKQATMQQLLTGKTRLPGFSGKWNVKALGELGTISGGGVDKKIKPGEIKVRLVNYMDVYRRNLIRSVELEHVVSAPPDQASRCAVRKGDIFFTPSSEMPYDIAASAVAAEDIPDACYSYHVARLRLHEEWDIPFRAYAFKTQAFLDQAAKTCEGSGVRYVITQGKFRQLTLKYPADRSEQAAIATVLADMDAELSALEARRDKTRALKQGMMQELLTGKTRLI